MLVLTRKLGEKLVIGGGITVTVTEIEGKRVRLAIDAPDEVCILRGELAWMHEPSASPSEVKSDSSDGGLETTALP